MGFNTYQYSAMLPDSANTDSIPERLAKALERHAVRLEHGPRLPLLYFHNYPFYLGLNVEHPVSADILYSNSRVLEQIGTEQERSRQYPFLLTMGSETPDPDMDHFNDSIFILEAIEMLWPEAILYHTQTGERV